MYHYDPSLALEELQEDALLPHPVKLRDMILRTKLDGTVTRRDTAVHVLERLATGQRKAS